MAEFAFEGMPPEQKFKAMRRELTALERQVAQLAASFLQLKERIDRLEGILAD